MNYKNKRERLNTEKAQLDQEVSSFISHWRDIADNLVPRRPRFQITDNNRGDRRNRNIIDSTATMALRTLKSGMMAGVTSPARPWFRVTTHSQAMSEIARVKRWLHEVTESMHTVFLRSNLYQVLISTYGDLGAFGTSVIYIEEDAKEVVRFYNIPIGSYRIANDAKLKVSVFTRELRLTVAQLIEKFGERDKNGEIIWDNFSTTVQNAYKEGRLQDWIDVCHRVGPNPAYDAEAATSKFKKFESCYYEKSCEDNGRDENVYLRESGYDYFPILAPRWEVSGEDVYGTNCPGMEAIGDIKQLQLGEKRYAQAIEKKINPPMTGPSQLKTTKVSILPGDTTFYDQGQNGNVFRPAHEVNLDLNHLQLNQQEIRNRLKRCFYEDLFLMLASSDRRQITAREIDERHEEKLLALGPVLEQLNQDLLDPLIDITFAIMLKQSTDAYGNVMENALVPPPPPELQGMDLKVEYISIMAQAQKMIGIGSHERFMNNIVPLVQVFPDITRKVNIEQFVDIYSDMVSVAPSVIRSDEEVDAMKQEELASIQRQQAMESAVAASQTAKNLSQADMEGDNALNRLVQNAQAGSLVEGGL